MWLVFVIVGVVIGLVLLTKRVKAPIEEENIKPIKNQKLSNEAESIGKHIPNLKPFESIKKDKSVATGIKKAYRLDYDCAYDFDAYPFELVGEAHYQSNISQFAIKRDGKGCYTEIEAKIIRELNNSFDKNACRVEIKGLTVGYFPRNNAESWVKLLSRLNMSDSSEVYVNAVIVGGGGKEYSFGVKLDIPSRVANSAKYIKEI